MFGAKVFAIFLLISSIDSLGSAHGTATVTLDRILTSFRDCDQTLIVDQQYGHNHMLDADPQLVTHTRANLGTGSPVKLFSSLTQYTIAMIALNSRQPLGAFSFRLPCVLNIAFVSSLARKVEVERPAAQMSLKNLVMLSGYVPVSPTAYVVLALPSRAQLELAVSTLRAWTQVWYDNDEHTYHELLLMDLSKLILTSPTPVRATNLMSGAPLETYTVCFHCLEVKAGRIPANAEDDFRVSVESAFITQNQLAVTKVFVDKHALQAFLSSLFH